MKKIKILPRVEIAGAEKLSPADMNKIHFDSGRHSSLSTK